MGTEGVSMDVRYKIDRFEEDFAVCIANGERTVNIPFEIIPADSVVGDSLVYVDGAYKKAD
jgi:hypothetical protein